MTEELPGFAGATHRQRRPGVRYPAAVCSTDPEIPAAVGVYEMVGRQFGDDRVARC